MFAQSNDTEIFKYIETPRPASSPTKIDVILQQRIKAFMRARRRTKSTILKNK